MKIRLRGWLRRNRGLLLAGGFVVLFWFLTSVNRPKGPKLSWVEPVGSVAVADRDVASIKFSPDGRSLLTYNRESVKLRDLNSGLETHLYQNKEKICRDKSTRLDEMGWMGNGQLLVGVVSETWRIQELLPTLHVWESPSGLERLAIPEVGDGVWWHRGFAISDDGSTLVFVTGSPGPFTVGVWRNSEDWQIRYFAGGSPLAISRDGKKLALREPGKPTDQLIVWEVETSKPLGSISLEPETPLDGFEFSPDGELLAKVESGQSILFEASTLKVRQVLETAVHGRPTFSPDGKLFFLQGEKAEVWNLDHNPPLPLFLGKVVSISPDGHLLLQSGRNEVGSAKAAVNPQAAEPFQFVELPSMKPGRRLEKTWTIQAHVGWFLENDVSMTFGPDGRVFAYDRYRPEIDWKQYLMSWLPGSLPPFPDSETHGQRELKVEEVRSGRILNLLSWPERDRELEDFQLLKDGKTLVVRYSYPTRGNENEREVATELWDVPAPSPSTPLVYSLAALTLTLGGWYDRRARRRVTSNRDLPVV